MPESAVSAPVSKKRQTAKEKKEALDKKAATVGKALLSDIRGVDAAAYAIASERLAVQ